MNSDQEQIISRVAEMIGKEKKNLEISNSYLSSQVKNKQKTLEELQGKIEKAKAELATLEDTLMKEKASILDQIEDRRKKAEEYERKSRENLEFTVRERNFLEQEKSNVFGKRVELDNLVSTYSEKLNKIRAFMESLR